MKFSKKLMIVALTIIGALVIGTGVVYARNTITKDQSISADEALTFACVDAGVPTADVDVIKIELERDDLQYVYDI